MLQRKDHPTTTTGHGFLVYVELEDGGRATPEHIRLRLADSLTFIEDVGAPDVTHLGEIKDFDKDVDE